MMNMGSDFNFMGLHMIWWILLMVVFVAVLIWLVRSQKRK
jgi:hypothetical protein